MNRTGLLIALAIAVVAGVVFGLYPELDLRIARYFYSFEDAGHNTFAFRLYPPVYAGARYRSVDRHGAGGAGCGLRSSSS